MAVYMVTWNLNKEKKNYAAARKKLIAVLSEFDAVYDTDLETVWFVSTNQNANSIAAEIQPCLDANDRLFVTRLSDDQYQGWMLVKIWDWINARV